MPPRPGGGRRGAPAEPREPQGKRARRPRGSSRLRPTRTASASAPIPDSPEPDSPREKSVFVSFLSLRNARRKVYQNLCAAQGQITTKPKGTERTRETFRPRPPRPTATRGRPPPPPPTLPIHPGPSGKGSTASGRTARPPRKTVSRSFAGPAAPSGTPPRKKGGAS